MGFFRALLAILVVIAHISGGVGLTAGMVAVFSFYTLSGYLITRVVCTSYSDGLNGLRAFILNRFLRLYPTYWFIAIVSLGIVLVFPQLAVALNGDLHLPKSIVDTVAQVTIVGLHKISYLNHSRLLPPAWSLNVEIIYYALISVLLGRTRWVAMGWWVASLVLASITVVHNDIHAAYFTIWGPSICFATGAVIYHFIPPMRDFSGPQAFVRFAPFVIIVAVAFAPDLGFSVPEIALVYSAIPLTVLAIVTLQARWDAPRMHRIDEVMGDISYPIFLSHWPLAVLVSGLLLGGAGLSSSLFFVTLPVVLLFSLLVNRFVEAPLRVLRSKIRQTAASAAREPSWYMRRMAGSQPRPHRAAGSAA